MNSTVSSVSCVSTKVRTHRRARTNISKQAWRWYRADTNAARLLGILEAIVHGCRMHFLVILSQRNVRDAIAMTSAFIEQAGNKSQTYHERSCRKRQTWNEIIAS